MSDLIRRFAHHPLVVRVASAMLLVTVEVAVFWTAFRAVARALVWLGM